MKTQLLILLILLFHLLGYGQETEIEPAVQDEWETLVEMDENASAEDQDELPELERLRKHPLNLNKVSPDALKQFAFLTELQINNLINYRKEFGDLLHLFEMQAIPAWDIRTIKRLLPYIDVVDQPAIGLIKSWKEFEQQLLIRYGNTLEKSKGFRENRYLGSSDKLSVRYRVSNSTLRWGIAADKDAGERLFKGTYKPGFDFYTFHLFLRKSGVVESLAVGDFTVNMGQGLIQWQSLAFKKSAAVANIKRQSTVLRPYTATGEVNFLRGAGVTLKKKSVQVSFFSSYRKISAHLEMEPTSQDISISSFLVSGNHRTANEIKDRNNITQFTSGAVLHWSYGGWQVSGNAIFQRFNLPVEKRDEPYNLYALNGRSFMNTSIDYSYTVKNVHLFGEIASDKQHDMAMLHGLLISIDRRLDAAVLFRCISKRYQAVNGNAFTENTIPNNETGLYSSISFRPVTSVVVDAYLDMFQFPWLKNRVNAPSAGKDFLISITFKPNKILDCYVRLKQDYKYLNETASGQAIDPLRLQQKRSIRFHAAVKVSKAFTFQNRMEFTGVKHADQQKDEGSMMFADLSYKPALAKWSVQGRLQFFNIDSYEARIYSYESHGTGLFSIPSLYGNGKRYLVNINRQVTGAKKGGWKLHASVSWMQTFYRDVHAIGSGMDEIQGNHRSEVTAQLRMNKE